MATRESKLNNLLKGLERYWLQWYVIAWHLQLDAPGICCGLICCHLEIEIQAFMWCGIYLTVLGWIGITVENRLAPSSGVVIQPIMWNFFIKEIFFREIMQTGGRLNINMSYQYRIPMFKIRRSVDRLIFNMGIPIPWERRFLYWDGALLAIYYAWLCLDTERVYQYSGWLLWDGDNRTAVTLSVTQSWIIYVKGPHGSFTDCNISKIKQYRI